jgi:hypothetical protein
MEQNTLMASVVFADGTSTSSGISAASVHRNVTDPVRISGRHGTLDAVGAAETGYANAQLEVGLSRLYLRVIWSAANTFKGQFSYDGIMWFDVSTAAWSDTLTPTHFGVTITDWSGTGGGDAHAWFEYLRVTESDLSA